jgi:hypothetical protein
VAEFHVSALALYALHLTWHEAVIAKIKLLLYSRFAVLLFHFLRLLFDGFNDAVQLLDTKYITELLYVSMVTTRT